MKPFSILGRVIAVAIIIFALQSCFFGKGGRGLTKGDLTGVLDRDWKTQVVPFGMTVVPSGTFHMGQMDEDITSSRINMNKQVTIGGFFMDDSEITNNEYRQFINERESASDTSSEWTAEEIKEQIYPDTTVWMKDFSHHLGDPMVQYYYQHPAFDDYPVVGVSWFAAREFCKWRTTFLNDYRESEGQFVMPNFRLPSEAEWEYASRGGLDGVPFPWGAPYDRNGRGCALANFKPGRGNYYDDGYQYTSPAYAYFPNGFGLHDMAGNVAEWCEDAYHPASFPIVWDLNPTYFDDSESRKIVRGGSWKDISFYVQTGTRSYEFKDTTRSYIGFRCVMTGLGRSSGYEFY